MEYGLVVLWLAVYLALGLAALPLAGALFEGLADRGAAFAVPLALAVLGVAGYVVGQVAFGLPALLAGLAVLIVAAYRLAPAVDVDYRAYARAAAVFGAAFLLVVAIRAQTPEIAQLPIASGEKFLDYGLLKSLLRAEALPPEDFWFAGEPVQYYYGGQMIVALLVALTGTGPEFAYNLGLAGFFGAYVVAAYGLAANLAARHGGPRELAGLLGAFFVALAANLHTAAQVGLWLLPDGLARPLVGAVGLGEEAAAWTPADFHFWAARGVMPSGINEFPLFAWLNGDLHAHMTSPPFLLLVGGLCLAYWATPEDRLRRRRLLLFGAIPPVAGLLAVVNTWSFPSAVALTALTVAFAPADPATLLPRSLDGRLEAVRADGGAPEAGAEEGVSAEDAATGGDAPRGGEALASGTTGELIESLPAWIRLELSRDAAAGLVAAGILAVGVVWSLPFWLIASSSQPIDLLVRGTPLGPLLLVHGGFLLAFVPYLGVHAADELRRPGPVALAVLAGLAVGVWAGLAGLALFGGLLVAAWALLRSRADVGPEAVLVLGGIGLVLLVEFVNVDSTPNLPDHLGRWNTPFKAYAQVWALWAPAAGAVLARLSLPDRSSLPVPEAARPAAVALALAVVCTTGLYAGFALPGHFAGEGAGSLDGTAYVEQAHPAEAEAIAWLEGLDGQPNMASAPACSCNGDAVQRYRWANAPASLTGVPTVAGWGGWGGHEYIYRSEEAFVARVEDVRTMFVGAPAEQSALFARYDVEYVYVGPNERDLYGADAITVGEHPATSVAFDNDAVTIYRVDHDELPASARSDRSVPTT